MSEPTLEDSPLLRTGEKPDFAAVDAAQVVPALRGLLAAATAALERLEREAAPTWPGLLEPLEALDEPVSYAWSIVQHLLAVRNSPALRTAQETVQPEVVAFGLRMGQSRPVYERLQMLRQGPDWEGMPEAQRRIVEAALLQAELSGVGLDGEARETFARIQQETAELSTRFANHVLDATRAFALTLTDPRDAEGFPDTLRAVTAQAARASDEHPDATPHAGPWRITLDLPVYLPFLQHCRNPALREQVYRAAVTRASSGATDNTPLIERILTLRLERARLLGRGTHAEVSLATKMADLPGVYRLLESLLEAALPVARREFAELNAFARAQSGNDSLVLRHWDVPFWSERLREQRFAFTEEELRPYFPLPHVLTGLFALAERLFGIRIAAADGEAPVWHPDVRFFRVLDADGAMLAEFYLDPYSRPSEKRGGAWMGDLLNRTERSDGVARRPLAYLVCNQTVPVDGRPSLMSFREVETLFHEFGHGLQNMLTAVRHAAAAGINNVEWDAVELPSQFMEFWCYDPPTLRAISRHIDTGEALSDAWIERIRAARTFQAGLQTCRQVSFGLIDMELHHAWRPDGNESVEQVRLRVASRASALPPLPEDRSLCSFQHIFGGGYAAGYYSYKWAEVLAADAFAAFEEAGLDVDDAVRATGRRFRDTVLASGGGRHPMAVFRDFRGREPSVEALLRHSGLAGPSG